MGYVKRRSDARIQQRNSQYGTKNFDLSLQRYRTRMQHVVLEGLRFFVVTEGSEESNLSKE